MLVDGRRSSRETTRHVDVGRVSLLQGPLVANLLRFQKTVRPGWLFDVVEMTLAERDEEKRSRKRERTKKKKVVEGRLGRKEKEKERQWSSNKQLETWTGSKQEVIPSFQRGPASVFDKLCAVYSNSFTAVNEDHCLEMPIIMLVRCTP